MGNVRSAIGIIQSIAGMIIAKMMIGEGSSSSFHAGMRMERGMEKFSSVII
jgi:hypothetical protein